MPETKGQIAKQKLHLSGEELRRYAEEVAQELGVDAEYFEIVKTMPFEEITACPLQNP
jgi:hypothetical protein